MQVLISIHALRKESDLEEHRQRPAIRISIHALRKESDPVDLAEAAGLGISIHALRKESDQETTGVLALFAQFQSTLSVRRATACQPAWISDC